VTRHHAADHHIHLARYTLSSGALDPAVATLSSSCTSAVVVCALPLLLFSAISNAILEAAKRRAQEQQAAQALDEPEPGEADAAGGPRKRPKHEPIVWRSPSQQHDAAAGDK
jgi:hypothetical protein